MVNVFVSHRGCDLAPAERLAEDIERAGHQVWLDEWVIDLGRLGDPQAIEPLLATQQTMSSDLTLTVPAALATYEHEELHRILLSRDANGLSPGIDPDSEITDDDVQRYALATRQAPDEVRRAYEQLQGKYLLRLSWRSSKEGR